jgi:hypothetical protein
MVSGKVVVKSYCYHSIIGCSQPQVVWLSNREPIQRIGADCASQTFVRQGDDVRFLR